MNPNFLISFSHYFSLEQYFSWAIPFSYGSQKPATKDAKSPVMITTENSHLEDVNRVERNIIPSSPSSPAKRGNLFQVEAKNNSMD